MAKWSKRVEQLELYPLPRKIPDWKTLPVRVREGVIEDLIRMLQDRFQQCGANHEQEPGGPRHE